MGHESHASRPQTCADCGQPASHLEQVDNRFTPSQTWLCPVCLLAHRHLEHFGPGCCGE
jgi:hypothetical protein